MPLTKEELAERVTAMATIFNSILTDPHLWNIINDDSKQQITTGINKSYGQALSFLHEYQTTEAARNKVRTVSTQWNGDVTVGSQNDLFAKTVECKSGTAPAKTDINALIRKAVSQLAGETGHLPREGDVRVVDVSIDGRYNPWPMQGGSYGTVRSAISLTTLVEEAKKVLMGLIEENTNIKSWLLQEMVDPNLQAHRLNNHQQPFEIAPGMIQNRFIHPRSTRPVYIDQQNQTQKIKCLTFKIRYSTPYPLTSNTTTESLTSMTIQAFHNRTHPNTLKIELAKTIKLVGTALTPHNEIQDLSF
ncbi:MAG: hypothetical protein ACN6O6_11060 [Pseudomonas sp.]|uniref:hypothetical protein n=1 Tax=Pseudomonas sp. TaxID=306 RepID=UPI003D117262